ncbi:MAG: type II toxin-antitoxin system VapC family toxin [Ignavibacteria bacterium]|nr:type II toxin-antitoxin system VapC family toxin [Ignavibacteria bacterium]
MTLAPITTRDVEAVTKLPWLHKDPFDRMLIAQAISLNIPIISADPHFQLYDVPVMW